MRGPKNCCHYRSMNFQLVKFKATIVIIGSVLLAGLIFGTDRMLRYLLIVRKESQVQFSHYFIQIPFSSRSTVEARVVNKILNQGKDSCHFLEDGDSIVVFRWYGPCVFIVGADLDTNEVMVYEFMNLYVRILEKYFGKLTEKHILHNADRLHMVLEELVLEGELLESSSNNVIGPLSFLDAISSK